jgi:hypothetical protein
VEHDGSRYAAYAWWSSRHKPKRGVTVIGAAEMKRIEEFQSAISEKHAALEAAYRAYAETLYDIVRHTADPTSRTRLQELSAELQHCWDQCDAWQGIHVECAPRSALQLQAAGLLRRIEAAIEPVPLVNDRRRGRPKKSEPSDIDLVIEDIVNRGEHRNYTPGELVIRYKGRLPRGYSSEAMRSSLRRRLRR